MTTLVIAEHDNASLKGATLNTITAAAQVGGDVHVLVAGANAGAAAAAAAGSRTPVVDVRLTRPTSIERLALPGDPEGRFLVSVAEPATAAGAEPAAAGAAGAGIRRISPHPSGMKRAFLRVAHFLEGSWLALPASLRGFACQLHVYCAAQENGGRLVGARAWKSTQWRMVLGHGGSLAVVALMVERRLVEWDGDDLLLDGYDVHAEDAYRNRREAGRQGGIRSAAARLAGESGAQANSGQSPSIASPDSRADAPRVPVDRIGAEARTEGKGEEAVIGIGGLGSASDSLDFDQSAVPEGVIPETPDQAMRLFGAIFEDRHGTQYAITAADSMALRNEWRELEPAEMRERMTTYLASHPQTTASIGGFVGWSSGPAGLRGERR